MEHAAGLERIVVTGGLGAHDRLCRRLADLTGLPVERPADYEATARGTAFLVAGSPASWPGSASAARYEPATNRSLAERFARWEDEMGSALASQGR
jgi:glycerol kinase